MSKILYQLSLIIGLFLVLAGIYMKFLSIASYGWSFTKKGDLMNGTLDANGTLIISFILICFSIWNREMYKQEKLVYDRKKGIEKKEEILRKKYNVFRIRKINKKQTNN
jgi:hypothetical protein